MPNGKNVTLETLLEFAQKADARLDVVEMNMPLRQDVTIPAIGWTNDSGDTIYPYQNRLTIAGITTASRTDVILDAASVAVASDCGVCAVCETAANTVIFKSRTAPTADLTGLIYITRTAVEMSSAE